MPTTDEKKKLETAPLPDDQIKFSARHRPTLTPGHYTVAVNHEVTLGGKPKDTFTSSEVTFAVFGPRFALHDSDLEAVFPPAESKGQYSGVLPHVILSRPTLPWERTAVKKSAQSDRASWLALLVFTQDELGDAVQTGTVATLFPPSGVSGETLCAALTDETGDSATEAVTVIDLEWGKLKQVLPEFNELPLLSHVRFVEDADKTLKGDERAVVLANRTPVSNQRMCAHLVSLENCFVGNDFLGLPRNTTTRDSQKVRLASLYSWQFSSDAKEDEFVQRMPTIKDGTAPLRFPKNQVTGSGDEVKKAQEALDSGFLPLVHRLRRGGSMVSWYHGPFLPSGSPVPPSLSATLLPARAADKLLLYHSAQGLFDVSYAAAWELGRLLLLENTRIATALHEWKRASVRAARAETRFSARGNLLVGELPQPAPALPSEVAAWFAEFLGLLEAAPFQYLIPDEGYLPPESLRFFNVDPFWMECLFDGASAVARFTNENQTSDARLSASLPKPGAVSGLLFRSTIVSNFPNLTIEATANNDQRLTPLRRERLAPGVLLVLYGEKPQSVEFHLAPEAAHFGVDVGKDGEMRKNNVAVTTRQQTFKNAINMRDLAVALLRAKNLLPANDNTLTDARLAAFAPLMMERTKSFRFDLTS